MFSFIFLTWDSTRCSSLKTVSWDVSRRRVRKVTRLFSSSSVLFDSVISISMSAIFASKLLTLREVSTNSVTLDAPSQAPLLLLQVWLVSSFLRRVSWSAIFWLKEVLSAINFSICTLDLSTSFCRDMIMSLCLVLGDSFIRWLVLLQICVTASWRRVKWRAEFSAMCVFTFLSFVG